MPESLPSEFDVGGLPETNPGASMRNVLRYALRLHEGQIAELQCQLVNCRCRPRPSTQSRTPGGSHSLSHGPSSVYGHSIYSVKHQSTPHSEVESPDGGEAHRNRRRPPVGTLQGVTAESVGLSPTNSTELAAPAALNFAANAANMTSQTSFSSVRSARGVPYNTTNIANQVSNAISGASAATSALERDLRSMSASPSIGSRLGGLEANIVTEVEADEAPAADMHTSQTEFGKTRAHSTRRGRDNAVLSLVTDGSEISRNIAMKRFVDGPFDQVCSVFIVVNVVFLYVQLQYLGIQQGSLLSTDPVPTWPDLTDGFLVLEHVFTLFFTFELMFRLCVFRCQYFYSKDGGLERFNLFDAVLVIASCLDQYLISQTSTGSINLTMLRPFRFLRLLRTLRVARTVKLFSKLTLLVNTVAASFMALTWSIILLGIVMLMAALFLCQALSSSLSDEAIALETRVWIYEYYGTSSRAFYTVFELTFSGGWPNYVRTLVEEVSTGYACFFIFYIISVTFAMFRIITALFLRDTLALASSDAEAEINDKMKQREAYAEKLLDFFHAADASDDGYLTLEEFEDILAHPKVKTWLSIMDLDVHETADFFNILADEEGLVAPEEFVEGILRLKGGARAQDVVTILKITQKIAASVNDMRTNLERTGHLSPTLTMSRVAIAGQSPERERRISSRSAHSIGPLSKVVRSCLV